MRTAVLAIVMALAVVGNAAIAAAPSPSTPAAVITAAGRMRLLPGSAHRPDPGVRHRAVFNLTRAAGSPTEVDPGLDAVPGNRQCGVCPEHLPDDLTQYCDDMRHSPQG